MHEEWERTNRERRRIGKKGNERRNNEEKEKIMNVKNKIIKQERRKQKK